MIRTTLSLMMVLVMLCPAFQATSWAGISNLNELEKVVTKNLKNVKEASMDVVQTMMMGPQGKMVLEGTVYYQVPDKMKMTMKTTMMGQEMVTTAVNDGKIMWTETNMEKAKQVMKMDMIELKSMEEFKALPGMKSESMNFERVFYPIKDMKEKYAIKWLGKEKMNETDVVVVEAKLTDEGMKKLQTMGQAGQAAITMNSHQKLFFDPKTGFMKKMSALNSQGQEVMTMEFSNYNLKPVLDKDFFIYKAPEGIKVIDMTPMMKGMLENMTKASAQAEEKEVEKTEKDQKAAAPAEASPADEKQPATSAEAKKAEEAAAE